MIDQGLQKLITNIFHLHTAFSFASSQGWYKVADGFWSHCWSHILKGVMSWLVLKCLVESMVSLTVMIYASSLGRKCYYIHFLHGDVA